MKQRSGRAPLAAQIARGLVGVLTMGLTVGTFLTVAPPAVQAAATFTVNSTIDTVDKTPGDGICLDAINKCSLRAAIMEANALGGADTILVPAGTYTITLGGMGENDARTGDLDILDAVTIIGGGGDPNADPALTIIQAGSDKASGIEKVFSINPNLNLAFATTLKSLTIRYGRNYDANGGDGYGGGFDWDASGTGSLTVDNCIIEENSGKDGSGIFLSNEAGGNAIVTISRSVIRNNSNVSTPSYFDKGGGIFVGAKIGFTISNSQVTGNTADYGGGIGVSNNITDPSLIITGTTVSGNTAAVANGGGGLHGPSAKLDASNSTFSGNQNGGIYLNTAGSTLKNVTITANTGGGMTSPPVQTLYNTVVAGNTGGDYTGGVPSGSNNYLSGDPKLGALANNGAPTGVWYPPFTHLPLSTSPLKDAGNNTYASGLTKDQRGASRIYNGTVDIGAVEWTPAPTTTTLTSNAPGDTSIAGNAVTFTATVAGSGGTPGGTVTFKDNGTAFASGVAMSGGVATATLTPTTVGSHAITAEYSGDSAFAASTGSRTHTVTQAVTTTALSSSANPAVSGQSVTLTATVSSAVSGMTGTVDFRDGAASIGTATVSGGVATLSSALSVGSHSLTAIYSGDTAHVASTSPALTQTVNKASTTTAVSPTTGTVYGQNATFTATVSVNAPGAGAPSGTVQFKDGGTNLGAPVTLSGGTASYSTAGLSVGSHTITAVYSGDGNLNGSTAAGVTHTVGQAATAAGLAASPNPSAYGDGVTFTATVAAVAPGAGTPTGTVTFKDGASVLGTGTLTGGVATYTTASLDLAIGSHTITAVYGGDTNFTASTSSAVTQTVNKAVTGTTVAASVNPAVWGQSVTFTATVAPSVAGTGTPGGTVTFKEGATVLGTGTLSGGSATFATSTLSVATHNVTAEYSGDATFATSVSAVLSQVVNKAPTATALTSAPNPSDWGAAVTFTATVSVPAPGAGSPTGNVMFMKGIEILATVPLTGNTASFATSTLASAQTHNIVAVYNGDGNFATSTSAPVGQTVNRVPTTTALASTKATTMYGEAVKFTATVTGTTGAPNDGGVTFYDGAASLGTVPVSGGAAELTVTSLTVGSHTITAQFGGSVEFLDSSAAGISHSVTKASSTAAVTVAPAAAVWGESVTFTATVTPGSGAVAPSGTVVFKDGAAELGTVTLDGAGTATLTTSALAVGSHAVTVEYGGDATYTGSTSATLTYTVGQATTATAVGSGPNPSKYGEAVTLTATVTVTGAGSGTPTGTVTFKEGTATLGAAALAGGSASISVADLAVGSHNITAEFSGDTNFAGSTALALTQTVNPGATATGLTADVNPAVFGQPVTLRATVTAIQNVPETPGGTVTFFAGTDSLGPVTLDGTGKATLTVSSLAVGTHALTARYDSDATFAQSTSGALNVTIGKADSATALTVGPASPTFGETVTLTATVAAAGAGAGAPTGAVTFSDGGTVLGTVNLAGGTATFSTATLPAGGHSFSADYAGDGNFKASTSAPVSQSIAKATINAAIELVNSPTPYGQPIHLRYVLTPVAPATAAPTGQVLFRDDTTYEAAANLADGDDTLETAGPIWTVGGHVFHVEYTGDSNYLPATSGTVTHTVTMGESKTTVLSDANPAVYGQAVTFTATVESKLSTVTPMIPTGTVTFKNGTATLGSGPVALDAAGQATLTISSLPGGTHDITVVYSGDAGYDPSTSATLQQVVTKSATITTIGSGLNPSKYGEQVTLTATVAVVAPGTGTPSGTVRFMEGSTELGTGTLSGGIATLSKSNLTVGTHNITAEYSGDAGYSVSGSAAVVQVVSPGETTTALVSTGTSVFGETVTFTATVTPVIAGLPVPAGNVTFKDGDVVLGTMPLDGAGQAALSTYYLSAGAHTVTATFDGSPDFASSPSAQLAQTVQLADSTTTITSSANPSVIGQPVTFTATVSPAVALPAGLSGPAGDVVFKDGSTMLGTVSLAGGVATYTAPAGLALGGRSITAEYAGNASFKPSTGSLTQTVNQAATTTVLAQSLDSSVSGQPVTFTATVTVDVPGAGAPTGTVSFMDDTTTLQTVTLTGGTAAYTATDLAVGDHPIKAVYSGDTDFHGSASSVRDHSVSQASTTTTLLSDLNPAKFGEKVTFTATVAAVAPGSGTPTGDVVFKKGGEELGTVALIGGVATLETDTLPVGDYDITATYADSVSFVTSTATVHQLVNRGTAATVLTADVNPAVFGQTITLKATVTPAIDRGTPTGTVTFMNGGDSLGTATLDGAGQATVTVATLPVGVHTLTARYEGNAIYAVSDWASLNVTVNQAATLVGANVAPVTPVYGGTADLTASVTAVAPGAGAPSGTVTVKEGAATLGTGTLTAGATTIALPVLPAGAHTLTVEYGGDGSFLTGTKTISLTVDQAATTTAVASSGATVFGEDVTFTATVTTAALRPGASAPAGTVTFKLGDVVLGARPLAGDTATFTTNRLDVGTQTITAVYDGDANFLSSSGTVSQTVSKAATAVAVGPNAATRFGQNVTFTATVTVTAPGSGTPTGTVTFKDGGVAIGDPVALSGSTATLSISTLSAATHDITAEYSGDASFLGATSAVRQHTVDKADTTALLESSLNASKYGQNVTLTATVTANAPGSGTPTGTVTFKDAGSTIGTVALTGGVATLDTAALAVGTHNLTAEYSGDSGFNPPAAPAALSQVVESGVTTTSLAANVNPSVFGQPVTLTATVTAVINTGVPTGIVTFLDGGSFLGTATLNAAGKATITVADRAVASHAIKAQYNGDTTYAASESASLSLVVNQAATAVGATTDPSTYGGTAAVKVTVAAVAQGAGTPTGTVTLKEGTKSLATGTLSSGAAEITLPVLSVGDHTITVEYGGDSSFGPSSQSVTHTVSKTTSGTGIVSSVNPSAFGQSVTFTATVAPATALAAGASDPAGTVTFKLGDTELATATLVGGQAAYTTPALAVGTQTITAVYNGDESFQTSSATVDQTVNKATTAVTVDTTTATRFGQEATFTATVTVTAPGSGTPTGTITFKDGAATLGSATLTGGSAEWKTAGLAAGTHAITAVYSGDDSFSGATSAAMTHTVDKAETALAVTATPTAAGDKWTLSAAVSARAPGAGAPGGTVTFKAGGTTLGTGTLSSSATAVEIAAADLPANASVTAEYSGDGSFNGSTSLSFTSAATGAVRPLKGGESFTVTVDAPPGLTAAATLTSSSSSQDVTLTETAAGKYQYTYAVLGSENRAITVAIRLADASGNTTEQTLTPAVVLDNIAPAITSARLVNPGRVRNNIAYYKAGDSLTVEVVTEPGLTAGAPGLQDVTVRIPVGTLAGLTDNTIHLTETTTPGVYRGTYVVLNGDSAKPVGGTQASAGAKDAAGNPSSLLLSEVLIVDTAAPQVTGVDHDARSVTPEGAKVRITAWGEPDLWSVTYRFDLDGGVTRTGTLNQTVVPGIYEAFYTVQPGDVTPDNTHIKVAFQTVAGTEVERTIDWPLVFDTQHPVIGAITVTLSATPLKSGDTLTLSFASEPGLRARATVAGLFQNLDMTATGGTYSVTYTVKTGDRVTDAPVTITAWDVAGNRSDQTAAQRVTVVAEPPAVEVKISKQPDGLNGWYVTAPVLTFTVDAGATLTLQDGATAVSPGLPQHSGTSDIYTYTVPDGVHAYTYSATQGGSPAATGTLQTLKVDTAAPHAPTLTADSLATRLAQIDLHVTVRPEDQATRVELSSRGRLWRQAAVTGATFDLTGVDLMEGPNTFTVRAYDEAGNVSPASALVTVTRDTTVPTFDVTVDLAKKLIEVTPSETLAATPALAVTMKAGDTSVAVAPASPAKSGNTYRFTWSQVVSNQVAIQVTASGTDLAGNAGTGYWISAKVVPSRGGTVEGGDVTAEFPPGALTDGAVVMTSYSAGRLSGSAFVPPGTQLLNVYEFTAVLNPGASVSVSMTMEIAGDVPPMVGIYHLPVGSPDQMPQYVPAKVTKLSERDGADGVKINKIRIEALLPHFSVWAPFVDTTPPDFTAAVLINGKAAAGQAINTTTATLTGTVDGTARTVEAVIGGTSVAVQDVGALSAADKAFSLAVPLGLDGTKTITVKAVDEFGNVNTRELTVVLDTQAPVVGGLTVGGVAYDSASNGGIVATSFTEIRLAGSTEPTGSLTVTGPSGTVVSGALGSFDVNLTPAPNADSTYTIVATDAAGNQSGPATVIIRQDTTAPVLTFSSLPPITPNFTIAFGYSVNELVQSVELSVDGGATLLQTSFTAQSKSAISLQFPDNGNYTLTATVTDLAGNVATASRSIVVNDLAPEVTMTTTQNPTPGGITINVEARSGGVLLTGDTTVTVWLQGQVVALPDAIMHNGSFSHTFKAADLQEGRNSAVVSLVGPNSVSGSTSGILVKDTVLPNASQVSVSPTLTPADATVTFSLSEDATAELYSQVGTSGWNLEEMQILSKGKHAIDLTLTADGIYQFRLVLTDNAGNQSTVAVPGTVAVDGTKPVIALTDLPTATGARDVTFGYTVNEPVRTVSLSVNGGAAAGLTSATDQTRSNISLHFPADGTYTVTATATDLAGNVQSVKQTILVDSRLPVVTVTAVPDLTDDTDSTLTVNATMMTGAVSGPVEDTAAVTVKLNGTAVVTGAHPTGGTFTHIFAAADLPEGDNVIEITVARANGLAGSVNTRITKDTITPDATDLRPDGKLVYSGPTLFFTLSEPARTLIEYRKGTDPWKTGYDSGATYLPAGARSQTPTLPDLGTYEFRITVTDALNHTRTVAFPDKVVLTTPPPAPPVSVTLTAAQALTREASVVLSGTAAAGAQVAIARGSETLTTLTIGADGAFQYTAALAEGENLFTAKATVGTQVATASVTVTRDSRAPSLSVSAEHPTAQAAEATLVIATEPGATVTVDGASVALKADGTARKAVALKVGSNEFTVVATDAAGNVTERRVAVTRQAPPVDPGPGPGPDPGPKPCPAGANLGDIDGHWAQAAICRLVADRIVTGFPDSTFRPEETVTRAQFMVMLGRTLGLAPDPGSADGFGDSAQIGDWAKGYVGALVKLGIARGDEEGTFRPDAQISRAELAVLMARVLAYKSLGVPGAPVSFTDQDQIPAWAMASLETAVANGLINGFPDGSFGPGAPATRAQAAVLIQRFLTLAGQ